MNAPLVYSSRARWCPRHSLLGLVFRCRMENARKVEAWYLITISSVIVAAIIAQFMAWSFWHEETTNSTEVANWYWAIQLGVVVFIAVGGFLGYCPGVRVVLTGAAFHVTQGRRYAEVDLNSVIECRIISALRYYRKWDGRSESYMTHIPEDVLLVLADQRSIAVGIDPDTHAGLLSAMNRSEAVRSDAV